MTKRTEVDEVEELSGASMGTFMTKEIPSIISQLFKYRKLHAQLYHVLMGQLAGHHIQLVGSMVELVEKLGRLH